MAAESAVGICDGTKVAIKGERRGGARRLAIVERRARTVGRSAAGLVALATPYGEHPFDPQFAGASFGVSPSAFAGT